MIEKVRKYAIEKHASVNHKYGDEDYSFHLSYVANIASFFGGLIDEDQKENVLCACWVHDIIEDARETYNDVMKNTNKTVADLAYALTNEKGKNRAERASDKYYKEMHEVPNAVFIKLCDRIANISYSKIKGSSMFDKYKKENANFVEKLYRPELKEMFEFIDRMLNE